MIQAWRAGARAAVAAVIGTGLALGLPLPAAASPVEVVAALFTWHDSGWQVAVTLRHGDSGWAHYADLWVVEDEAGREIGRRVLAHPHENEQPFTRSQRIAIPPEVTRVRVRAGDNIEGLNSNVVWVDLERPAGERFRVER